MRNNSLTQSIYNRNDNTENRLEIDDSYDNLQFENELQNHR